MALIPNAPGIKLRRCCVGQRVRLLALANTSTVGEIGWQVLPAIYVVGRHTAAGLVLIHQLTEWEQARRQSRACRIHTEMDGDWPVQPAVV